MVHKPTRIGKLEISQILLAQIDEEIQSGLTDPCLNSPHSMEFGISVPHLCLLDIANIMEVTQSVLAYIQKWVPGHRVGVLAGSSVHADRSFLVEEMPQVVDWLHYR